MSHIDYKEVLSFSRISKFLPISLILTVSPKSTRKKSFGMLSANLKLKIKRSTTPDTRRANKITQTRRLTLTTKDSNHKPRREERAYEKREEYRRGKEQYPDNGELI